jgi:hypothetical protein
LQFPSRREECSSKCISGARFRIRASLTLLLRHAARYGIRTIRCVGGLSRSHLSSALSPTPIRAAPLVEQHVESTNGTNAEVVAADNNPKREEGGISVVAYPNTSYVGLLKRRRPRLLQSVALWVIRKATTDGDLIAIGIAHVDGIKVRRVMKGRRRTRRRLPEQRHRSRGPLSASAR